MLILTNKTLDRAAISIDPDHPGNQGEGVIAPRFWGLEIDNVSCEGVQIEKIVDIRDVRESLYKLEIKEGTNQAFLTQPILPAPFRKDKTQHEARLRTADDEHVKKAHNALRSAHSKLKETEQCEKIPLVFPESYQLTVKPHISAASKQLLQETNTLETVACKFVACKASTGKKDAAGDDIDVLVGRITWQVCNNSKATEMEERTVANAGEQAVDDGLSGL